MQPRRVRHLCAALLAAASLVAATPALATNVTYIDSFRQAFAQDGDTHLLEFTEDPGPWSASPDTGHAYASQVSDIQQDLFAVSTDSTIGFRPAQPSSFGVAASEVFVTFDVVGQPTQFEWALDLMSFSGNNDDRVGALFALDEIDVQSIFLTWREWVAGDPKPETITGLSGTVTLDPGRYSLGMAVFGNALGSSSVTIDLIGSFTEVPAPGSLALLGLAGLAAARRRR